MDFIDFPWFPQFCLPFSAPGKVDYQNEIQRTVRKGRSPMDRMRAVDVFILSSTKNTYIKYMHGSKFFQLFAFLLFLDMCICAYTCYIWVAWAAYFLSAKKCQNGWQATSNEGW